MKCTITTSKKKSIGITLIEILLVLVIISAIVLLSIRQYLSYRVDADVQQLNYNVDTLFQAMSQYYSVNCYGTSNADGTINQNSGALNFDTHPNLPNNVLIDMNNDLINNHFLTTTFPISPLVDSSGAGTNGYVLQFNLYSQTRNVCTTTTGVSVSGPNDPNCKPPFGQMATVLIWKEQVAVHIKDAAHAQEYLNVLNGDCLSDVGKNGIITPCNQAQSGSYVVFERVPSYNSANINSDYLYSNANVKSFTQMYTTYPILYLLNGAGQVPGPNGVGTQSQYIYCGG